MKPVLQHIPAMASRYVSLPVFSEEISTKKKKFKFFHSIATDYEISTLDQSKEQFNAPLQPKQHLQPNQLESNP